MAETKKTKRELLAELEEEERLEQKRLKEEAIAKKERKRQALEDLKARKQREREQEKQDKKKNLEDLKKLKVLFRKYKGVVKARYDTAPFKEPILMLERITGKVEFYDQALAGEYTFEHSDGRHRTIELRGPMKQFQYYDEYFRGWYCHEDFPFPLPEKPLLTSEMFTLSKDKDLNDVKNYKAQEITAKGKAIYQIAIGIAIIGGVIILALILFPDLFSGGDGGEVVRQTVKTTTPVIRQNLSNLTVL